MRRGRSFWAGLRDNVLILLVILALIFVAANLALPFVLRNYVNDQLDRLEEYDGSVGAIRVNLLRGAYQIINLRMDKVGGKVPVPFILIPVMDLSIEWPQLLRGALEGEIVLERPRVNFVNGPTEEEKQTGVDDGWKATVESLFPLTINRFEVKDGVLRYADPHREPPVDVYMTNLFAVATNLSNVEAKGNELPAGLAAKALTEGGGELQINLQMNPLAEQPTFKLATSLTGLDLTQLNDFLRSYVNVDAESGQFWVYLNVAAADGSYQGYVKPFFLDVNLVEWEEAQRQNLLQTFWEGLVGTVMDVFKNQPEDQVATNVPIAGEFEAGTEVDLWTTIGGILRNAFFQALGPGVPGPVPLPEEGGDQTASTPSKQG